MKKIISLTFVFSLFILSCSKNDNQVTTDTGLLCIKKLEKNVSGTIISETNFSYNGNKIVKAITNRNNFIYENRFFYTEDLITKVEYYYNNTLRFTSNFTYNSQKNLIQIVNLDNTNNTGSKYVYNYNSELSITSNYYQGNLTSQNQLIRTSSILLTKTNGEITIISENVAGSSYSNSINFFYDSKNNYMKNVLGYGKLTLLDGGFTIDWETYKHIGNYCSQNVTQFQESITSGVRNITSLYTYNTNNYPISETEIHTTTPGGTSSTRNFWYYYN